MEVVSDMFWSALRSNLLYAAVSVGGLGFLKLARRYKLIAEEELEEKPERQIPWWLLTVAGPLVEELIYTFPFFEEQDPRLMFTIRVSSLIAGFLLNANAYTCAVIASCSILLNNNSLKYSTYAADVLFALGHVKTFSVPEVLFALSTKGLFHRYTVWTAEQLAAKYNNQYLKFAYPILRHVLNNTFCWILIYLCEKLLQKLQQLIKYLEAQESQRTTLQVGPFKFTLTK